MGAVPDVWPPVGLTQSPSRCIQTNPSAEETQALAPAVTVTWSGCAGSPTTRRAVHSVPSTPVSKLNAPAEPAAVPIANNRSGLSHATSLIATPGGLTRSRLEMLTRLDARTTEPT